MPYYEKGREVAPSRPGSDAWLGRRVRAWSPIGTALSHVSPGDAETLTEHEARLDAFEREMAEVPGAVCGPRCWHAKSETCSCSCKGANHGKGQP